MAQLTLDLQATLGDFSLQVDDQLQMDGITALFGPSGSGKSTLLRIIAGLETRATGKVAFNGETWQHARMRVPAHVRGATLLFQDVRLFPHLDVGGNLDYAARRAPPSRDGADRHDIIRSLELDNLLDRRTQTLSGGEAQRVAIARALLARPRLLLMDEPLAALDLGRRARLLDRIEELPRRFGIPVLYVTHAIDEVARLADHTVLMQSGRWIARGDTADILERLDLPDLAAGSDTGALLNATVASHDDALALTRLTVGSWTLSVPALNRPAGAEVRLRVRARDVALATERPSAISIRNVLEGRVLEITTDGQSPYAEVLIDVDGSHLRARITRASVAELALVAGSRVYALIKSIALDS
ncbi:MAG: molybdenum ABC transporter ATP-binding protein [Chromatiales bacterium]|nr:MAG: molybdenum ABC transporter ATP-binding protein [Chromatiales bacterium]